MIKKSKKIIGSIIIIPISKHEYYYGRIIEDYVFVFYDYKSEFPTLDLTFIVNHEIIFAAMVNFNAIKTGDWEVIGKMELDDRHRKRPIFYQGDLINKSFYEYNVKALEKTLIYKTFEKGGLQDGGIYSFENIKERLIAYFHKKEYTGIKFKIDMLHQLHSENT